MPLVKVLFLIKKMLIFCKKNAEISKIKVVLVLKGIFSETTYVCVLTHQFQVPSIILTSFRQGEFTFSTLKSSFSSQDI